MRFTSGCKLHLYKQSKPAYVTSDVILKISDIVSMSNTYFVGKVQYISDAPIAKL